MFVVLMGHRRAGESYHTGVGAHMLACFYSGLG